LGYAQYGLEVRRQDFDSAFGEVVDKTLELKPDFMIIAGDLFHQARPSNHTLENTVRSFKRLKDANISVLTVDGSHDTAPNTITSTILYPLDSAGLIFHLPRHRGSCWSKPDCCYVYGIPSYHNRPKTLEALPIFMAENPPTPQSDIANIFVFHGALDLPNIKPAYLEAEIPPELLPDGFCYYAAGHIHNRYMGRFKSGILAYSGCTESSGYDEGKLTKGFYHVSVNEQGQFTPELIELSSPRRFISIEYDFTGLSPAKITEMVVEMIKEADEADVILVPIIGGTLPAEASRSEVDVPKIRSAAQKALLVHPIVQLRETAVSDEVVRSIFEDEFKDLKTKALGYFVQIFSDRYGPENAERIAYGALSLIEPLAQKQDAKVKQVIEELIDEN